MNMNEGRFRKAILFAKLYWREIAVLVMFFLLQSQIGEVRNYAKKAYSSASDASDYASQASSNAQDASSNASDAADYCSRLQ